MYPSPMDLNFMTLLFPVLVPLRNKKIDEEIRQAHQGEQPVEKVQIVTVKVVSSQPTSTARNILRCMVHYVHKYGAKEVPQRHRTPKKTTRNRLKILWSLGIEEFQKSHVGEHISYPEYEVLN